VIISVFYNNHVTTWLSTKALNPDVYFLLLVLPLLLLCVGSGLSPLVPVLSVGVLALVLALPLPLAVPG